MRKNKFSELDKSISKIIMKEFKGKVIEHRCQDCNGIGKFYNEVVCDNCNGEGKYLVEY